MQFYSIFSDETYMYKKYMFGNMYFIASNINKFSHSYRITCKNIFVQQIKIKII